jgi:hypothetical protein
MPLSDRSDSNHTVYDVSLDQQAYDHAAQYGDLVTVQALLPKINPRANNAWGFEQAALNGHLDIVRQIMAVCPATVESSSPLRAAAQGNHLAMVELLLPHSHPKDQDSAALRWALRHGNEAMVTLLAPVSDLWANFATPLKALAPPATDALGLALIPHLDMSDTQPAWHWPSLDQIAQQWSPALQEALLAHAQEQASRLPLVQQVVQIRALAQERADQASIRSPEPVRPRARRRS